MQLLPAFGVLYNTYTYTCVYEKKNLHYKVDMSKIIIPVFYIVIITIIPPPL